MQTGDSVLRPTDRTALVTHRGCLDGTGSALMFIWAGGRRENVIFKNPTGAFLTADEAAPFDEVWFADLCPPSLEDPAGGKPFHVFDHHLSNQRKFGDDPRCTFDMKKSGTSLMAAVLGIHDDPESAYQTTDELIAALEAYDLGRFDEPAGMRLADVASSYSQEQMLEIMVERDPEGILYDRDLTTRAEALADVRKLYAEQAAKYRYRFVLDGIMTGVAVSPVYWKNEVAQRLLAEQGTEMALIIDPTTQMVSLRSLPGGPDCSTIAGRYGGGGHARAAGFKGDGLAMLKELTESVIG